MDKPLVFVSYCREDAEEKDELVSHLKVLRHDNVELWVDDKLAGGEEWERTILERIDRAAVAVLLVSEHFLNSDFICQTELPALQSPAPGRRSDDVPDHRQELRLGVGPLAEGAERAAEEQPAGVGRRRRRHPRASQGHRQ